MSVARVESIKLSEVTHERDFVLKTLGFANRQWESSRMQLTFGEALGVFRAVTELGSFVGMSAHTPQMFIFVDVNIKSHAAMDMVANLEYRCKVKTAKDF